MRDAVHECAGLCNWKLQCLLRSRRFYSVAELVGLYKVHVLSYIEYRTPAIAHAAATTLAPIDSIQARFLREVGLSEEDALINFNLAPLHTRRDMAVLGVIHRAAIGHGPSQLRQLFPLMVVRPMGVHERQILDLTTEFSQEYIQRSALGYVKVYNALRPVFVEASSAKSFQRGLPKNSV